MFIVPQITYCRITDANRAIAITNNGGTSDSVLEEVINPVSLITGKITTELTLHSSANYLLEIIYMIMMPMVLQN
jgi:hypothetical protein